MLLKKTTIYFLSLLMVLIIGCGQDSSSGRLKLGRSYAEEALKTDLNNKNEPNYLNNRPVIIKDSLTAVKIAESILFGIYGEKNITAQRPYEVYLINNYWVLSGTLSKDKLGGTFLIIINSLDSKVLKIIHGK